MSRMVNNIMVIDTNNIKPGHSVVTQTTTLGEFQESLPPLETGVVCTAEIDRMSTALYVQLHFEGTFTLSCARCLKGYSQNVSGDCRVILEEKPGCSGPANDDGTADYYFNDDEATVDISAFVFDEVMTSIPLMPLCSSTCTGIEVKKAKNTQEEEMCDPRWDALKKLKR